MSKKQRGRIVVAAFVWAAFVWAASFVAADVGVGKFVNVRTYENNGQVVADYCDAALVRFCDGYAYSPRKWNVIPIFFVAARRPDVAGVTAFCDGKVERITIYQPFATAKGGTLDHELGHAFLFHCLQGVPPLFFNEGFAQISETEGLERNRTIVYRRFAAGEFVSLRSLINKTSYDPNLLLYVESFSASEYLVYRGGLRTFLNFVDSVRRSGDVDSALKRYYGFDNVEAFESAWIRWIRNGQNPNDVERVTERR